MAGGGAPKVRLDYEQVNALVDKFEAQADQVDALLRRMRGKVDDLQLHHKFKGDNANFYFQTMKGEVLESVKQLYIALVSCSEYLEKTSASFKKAEEAAESRFVTSFHKK